MAHHSPGPLLALLCCVPGFGLRAQSPGAGATQIAETACHNQRVIFYGELNTNPTPGQISVAHAHPRWSAELAKRGDALPVGGLLAVEPWASLDTNHEISVGKRRVPAGRYYLALRKTAATEWHPALLPAEKVLQARLEPTAVGELRGVLDLYSEVVQGDGRDFALELKAAGSKKEPNLVDLGFDWGPHHHRVHLDVRRVNGSDPLYESDQRQRSSLRRERKDGVDLAWIEYYPIGWRAEFDEWRKKLGSRFRWRLGRNFWSTLETNVELKLGGKRVAAGVYYLALQAAKDKDEYRLVLFDDDKVRKKAQDAKMSFATRGGIEVPMRRVKGGEDAVGLVVRFLREGKGEKEEMELEVRWGPYGLRAPVVVQ